VKNSSPSTLMELIEVDTSLYEELEKYEGGHVIFNFIPLYIIA
jgi:hypothetical protein